MKKNAPFKLRSGNKPSPAKFFKGIKNTGLAKNLGSKQFQETGERKKFSETKVGKTSLGKELSKLTGTIFGGGKFKGEKSIGGQIKNMLTKGNKGKITNPKPKAPDPEIKIPNASKNFNKKIGVSTESKFNVNKPKITKPSKPKTTYSQAFDKMKTAYGKTRMERYKKNPYTGELYPMSKGGLETFTSQAKSFNKKKGQ